MPASSYAQVVDQSRQAIANARLTDPEEHFPYKRQAVDDLLFAGEAVDESVTSHLGECSDCAQRLAALRDEQARFDGDFFGFSRSSFLRDSRLHLFGGFGGGFGGCFLGRSGSGFFRGGCCGFCCCFLCDFGCGFRGHDIFSVVGFLF